MYFFFDNNFPPAIVDILKLLGVDGCHLREKYSQNTADEEWIPEVAKEGWITISADKAIWKNAAQRSIIQSQGLKIVFMPDGFVNYKMWDQAEYVVRHWPKIIEQLNKLKQIKRVRCTVNGKIETLD